MRLVNKSNTAWFTWLTFIFFACIYCLISIYNHAHYRTFAFDLGIKNQVIWDYAHLRMNYNSLMPELHGEINVLANHFEPILFIIAPLYYIFGSYTLLVVQIGAILLGGWGVYKYVLEISGDRLFATFGMAMFYAMWGILGALSFDFHTNVVAAVMVPWLFYFVQKKNRLGALLFLTLILLCKENMALWMVFVGMGIALHFARHKAQRNQGILIAAVSAIYFVVVMKFAMPFFADGKMEYLHFKYSALGSGWKEALQTVFTRPGYVVELLFRNHVTTGDPAFNEQAKWQTHVFVFLSGGIFLLFRPQFLVMLIPIYAQKMFSDDPAKWSVFQQYSIEFVPIIVLATFTVLNKSKTPVVKVLAGALMFLAAFDTSKEFAGLWKPLPYGKVMTNFYQPSHYQREITKLDVYDVLKDLPPKASVSATFYLVPHIANRKTIYQFPEIKDAEYVAFMDDGVAYYPLADNTAFRVTRDSLVNSGHWQVVNATPYGMLLKRNP